MILPPFSWEKSAAFAKEDPYNVQKLSISLQSKKEIDFSWNLL
jgi:hypothetical protein